MDDPTIISVGFSTSKDITAELIKKFTGGDVSHTFLYYKDPVLDTEVTFGANANGFTMIPVSDFPDKIVRIYTPLARPLLIGFRNCISLINKPYDFTGLFGMAIVEFDLHVLNLRIKNPMMDRQKLWCSEAMTIMLRSTGYDILPDKTPGTIDPWMLERAMYSRPDIYKRTEMLE